MKNKKSTRREFLGTSASLATMGLAIGCSRSTEMEDTQTAAKESEAAEATMKLSLSVRVAETFGSKEKSAIYLKPFTV